MLGYGMCTKVANCDSNDGSAWAFGVDSSTWDLRAALRSFERRHISAVLASSGGDKVIAARRLGIGLSSLYRKLDEAEVETMDDRLSETPANCEESS